MHNVGALSDSIRIKTMAVELSREAHGCQMA
jgi:hypothetical protein